MGKCFQVVYVHVHVCVCVIAPRMCVEVRFQSHVIGLESGPSEHR